MNRIPDLHRTLHALHQPKENGQARNQRHSKPEIIPLHRFPAIFPPLRYTLWFRFVKNLLQNNETIVPVVKIADLTVFGCKVLKFDSGGIEIEVFGL